MTTTNMVKRLRQAVPGILLACIFLSSNASASLIHSYNYSGNASDSVGTANGTVIGATLTSDRFGNANSAYSFNGESYIDSFFSNPLTSTVAIWAKLGAQTDVGDMLFSFDSGVSGINLWFYPYANVVTDAMWNTWDSQSNAFSGSTDVNSAIRDNQFHHFAVVNNQTSGVTSLFVDGVLRGTASYRQPVGNLFRVGAGKRNLGYAWDGVIDDVEVYSSALSSNQVSTLFRTGSVEVSTPSTLLLFALGIFMIGRRQVFKP